jgi:hypothetical protein
MVCGRSCSDGSTLREMRSSSPSERCSAGRATRPTARRRSRRVKRIPTGTLVPRALDVARAAFGSAGRPDNAMVIPASAEGDWFVYLVPAPIQPGVFPPAATRAIASRRTGGR